MKHLLLVNSSGRRSRSVTRRLNAQFASEWKARFPGGQVANRDVGLQPPPPVDEPWIAAAFADPAGRTPEMQAALQLSESLVSELNEADLIVIGAPIYNFGMPAQLKAWVDQIVRVGRTFEFQADAELPYRPLLEPKPVVVLEAAGDGALFPGGELAHLNFLEPHLEFALRFIGFTDITFIRVGYEEFQDDRWRRSVDSAQSAVSDFVSHLPRDAPRQEPEKSSACT